MNILDHLIEGVVDETNVKLDNVLKEALDKHKIPYKDDSFMDGIPMFEFMRENDIRIETSPKDSPVKLNYLYSGSKLIMIYSDVKYEMKDDNWTIRFEYTII